MVQNRVIGPGSEREERIEVLEEKPAVVKRKLDLPGVESLAEGASKHRKEDSSVETAGVRMPFDVEKRSEGGLSSIFEDIHPPGIFGACGHVIGHRIE